LKDELDRIEKMPRSGYVGPVTARGEGMEFTITENVELLPCPFCGSTDLDVGDASNYEGAYVWCNSDFCAACGPPTGKRKLAIEAWNRRANGWISVEDRLPENETYIIGSWPNVVEQLWFFDGEFSNSDRLIGNVTHWQPLPKGPE